MINLNAYREARDALELTEYDWPLDYCADLFTAAFTGPDGNLTTHSQSDIEMIAEDLANTFGLHSLDYVVEWADFLECAA